MKTLLRTLLLFAVLGSATNQTKAQCAASDILIQNIVQSTTQTPGSCTVTFDLSFQMQNNNGNKFIYLNAFLRQSYNDYFECVNGSPSANGALHPPMAADLVGSFLRLGIDNNGTVPVLLNSYAPDPTVTLTSASSITKTVLPNGNAFFVITGVQAVFPVPCGSAFVIAFDFWSSQGAQGQVVQCVNCNVLYPINFLSLGGLANCASLSFNAVITNNTDTIVNGFVRVYADVNGDGYLQDGVDVLIKDTTNFTIAAGPGTTTSITGTIPPININQDLLILTNITSDGASGAAQLTVIPTTLCGPLPVTFRTFTASRLNSSNVSLRWETSTEINNSGFAIQRNMGKGVWELVAFVPSQAVDGNSTSSLVYTFTDLNSSKGITQYRIKQVDLDGKAKFSDIRAVRGFGQKGQIIVYPVPSTDGRVNVVFEDMDGLRDAALVDMSGRMIKQWKSISGNTLTIENLKQGMYTLRIMNQTSGEVSVEKIIVAKTKSL